MDQFWDLRTLIISIIFRPPAQGTCRPTSLPHRLAFFPGQSRPPSLNKGHFSAFFGRIFPITRLWRKYTFSQAVFNRTFFIYEQILSYSPAVPRYLSNDQFTSNNKLEIKFIFAHSAKLSLVWFDKNGGGGGFWCKICRIFYSCNLKQRTSKIILWLFQNSSPELWRFPRSLQVGQFGS